MIREKSKVKIFYFEVTNACNFRCDFCPINLSQRKRQHMDFSLFTKGVDSIAKNKIADTIGFHVLGEPLLYPKILEAIDYARQKGLKTTVTTNGSLLTEEKVHGLMDAGLNRLNISLQRFGEEQHACRRAPLPFAQYYQRIMDAVKQIHFSSGRTILSVFLMNNSTQKFFDIEMPMQMTWNRSALQNGLATLIRELYATIGNPVSLEKVDSAIHKHTLRPGTQINISERVRVTIKPFLDWGNTFTTSKVYPATLGFCGLAFSTMALLSNGQVILCCGDYDGHTSLGNLGTQSLESILASDQARSIDKGFRQLRVVHPHCQRCLGSTNPIKTAFRTLTFTCLFKIIKVGTGKPIKQVTLFNGQEFNTPKPVNSNSLSI